MGGARRRVSLTSLPVNCIQVFRIRSVYVIRAATAAALGLINWVKKTLGELIGARASRRHTSNFYTVYPRAMV